jgi:enoyl-CoA hydratase/carnithine racemase
VRKNPQTFDAYAEMRDLFGRLKFADDMHTFVLVGAGGNFCSGGDVHEIIGPLVRLMASELPMFTRTTGDLVKAMRALTFASGITKTMLHQGWAMTIEQAIEAEAQAQAICMLTEDFSRAFHAFVAKSQPRFKGN